MSSFVIYTPRQLFSRLQSTGAFAATTRFSAARLYSTSEKAQHTPDTYQKDGNFSEPSSSKTHVVSGQLEGNETTQRPFESPTGAYTTTDSSKPYDAPATEPEEEHTKSGYGGLNRGGKGVEGGGGPQDQGKKGRI